MKSQTYKFKTDETLLNWYSDLVNVTRNNEQETLYILIKDELNNRLALINT